jgi:hypothetical protein
MIIQINIIYWYSKEDNGRFDHEYLKLCKQYYYSYY